MKRFWIESLLCTAVLASGILVFTTPTAAHPAFLTAEKKKNPDVKSCTYCHINGNGKGGLNPTGTCYGNAKPKSLDGCPVPAGSKPAATVSHYLAELDHTRIAE
jgi:hypothetical protein